MTLFLVASTLLLSLFALVLVWVLRKKNKLLLGLTRFDAMTGALNHTETNLRCENEAERSLRTHKPFAILEIDIDHFKNVNDRHGHQVGDEVLASLVACVSRNLRTIDLFGRIGGEEFIAILPETNASGATDTAERVRKALELHVYETSCGELQGITVSIGVTVFEPSPETRVNKIEVRKQLFKQADDAMYEAKNSGRNRVVLWNAQSFGAR
jgi:diguanylate cyclase (GGDEF)-like protein